LKTVKEEIVAIKTNGHQIETEEILEGFLYSYRQLDTNALKVYEASAHLYSLIELLVAKGIIGVDELDQRKKAVEKRLKDSFKEAGIGVRVQGSEVDKYNLPAEAKIDCENRKHLCHAACCALAYALSPQDIREGIRWCLSKPFMNARGADGYCIHLQRDTLSCNIYEHRPTVCRQYDCRNDRRIWLDFDKMVINPDLFGGKSPLQNEEISGD
jgi:Fe-S-cluster containining protein